MVAYLSSEEEHQLSIEQYFKRALDSNEVDKTQVAQPMARPEEQRPNQQQNNTTSQ